MKDFNQDEYMRLLQSEYKQTVTLIEQGKIHPLQARVNLSCFLEAQINPNDQASLGILTEALMQEREYQTYKRNYLIGCFIKALVLYGSSANQAYLGTAVFLGHKNRSPETSKKAYALFKGTEDSSEKTDAEKFVYWNVYRLKKVIDIRQCTFPQNFRKARRAYDLLSAQIKREIQEDEALEGKIFG